jgi:hypothetical protein
MTAIGNAAFGARTWKAVNGYGLSGVQAELLPAYVLACIRSGAFTALELVSAHLLGQFSAAAFSWKGTHGPSV